MSVAIGMLPFESVGDTYVLVGVSGCWVVKHGVNGVRASGADQSGLFS